MKKIKVFLKTLMSAIYLNKCICCGEIINEDFFLCVKCDAEIKRINPEDICIDCGLDKKNCACKYNIFRFNGLVCTFNNSGIARQAYYSYKFGKKQHYAEFFADEICNSIRNCYKDIDFDFVCSVPSYKKAGYNHSYYIAKIVAGKLQIPFDNELLSCIKKVKKQHKSTIKERMHNVDGKYCANYRVDNKNVLLIDDIRTTGATLDECARVLLFSGAESVFCATVLGTASNNN